VDISCILMYSVCNYLYVFWNLSDLKWLQIESCGSFSFNLSEKYDEDSMFIMDAVFVKVFSLMHLEYLHFNVKNAKVNTLLYYDHTWSFIIFVLEYYIHLKLVSL
jgi:hypothetical protein